MVLEMRPHAVNGGVERLNATMARGAALFLVGIKPEGVLNRDEGPRSSYLHLAGVVANFGHDPNMARNH
jgi:hypothetical protein